VILTSLRVDRGEFEKRTGWELKPEGACKAHMCVPLSDGSGDALDARMLSERLSMPLVADESHGLWSLGPESGGRALASADFPDLTLPDWHGDDFDFRSLRGQKIFLLAWASW
jgi:hypothetical protein